MAQPKIENFPNRKLKKSIDKKTPKSLHDRTGSYIGQENHNMTTAALSNISTNAISTSDNLVSRFYTDESPNSGNPSELQALMERIQYLVRYYSVYYK